MIGPSEVDFSPPSGRLLCPAPLVPRLSTFTPPEASSNPDTFLTPETFSVPNVFFAAPTAGTRKIGFTDSIGGVVSESATISAPLSACDVMPAPGPALTSSMPAVNPASSRTRNFIIMNLPAAAPAAALSGRCMIHPRIPGTLHCFPVTGLIVI